MSKYEGRPLMDWLLDGKLPPGKQAQLTRIANAAPGMLQALHAFRALPWQHNFGSTASLAECRAFLAQTSKWWNEVALPIIADAEGA